MRALISPRARDAVEFRRGTDSQNGLYLEYADGIPVLPAPTEWSPLRDIAKRVFDFSTAAVAIIALGPALVGLGLAVRLSGPGPVIFRQWRIGRHGMPFQIYKFRTMHPAHVDESGVLQVTLDDPRVTRLGAFMRSKSLDELPQLLNVLRGDMSFVGPRPHVPGMKAAGMPYEELVPYYHLRHAVRPGISGWAQANGLRGPTTDARAARARVDHDIAYIQNRSLLLDLRIILSTLRSEFLTGSGN